MNTAVGKGIDIMKKLINASFEIPKLGFKFKTQRQEIDKKKKKMKV